ncbi:hypothetical protein ACFQ88_25375 [Paenibacillus sp. NPDC056579]|uniref:hypothetical protein n=1 Tax=Paenibacillus sp. NPDC056579 TaxID=3345871 RepID=UPI003698493F
MILIGVVFVFIIGFEWFYLRRKQRKRRTFLLALGTALILFLGEEVLYFFKEDFALVRVIQYVFGPIETLITGEGANK